MTAWRTCVELAWQVPRAAHTYLVDHLLCNGLSSVKTDIMSRYVKFLEGLRSSPAMEVRVMYGVAAGDVRTITGRNIWFLKTETGLDPTCSSSAKVKAVLESELATIQAGTCLGSGTWPGYSKTGGRLIMRGRLWTS